MAGPLASCKPAFYKPTSCKLASHKRKREADGRREAKAKGRLRRALGRALAFAFIFAFGAAGLFADSGEARDLSSRLGGRPSGTAAPPEPLPPALPPAESLPLFEGVPVEAAVLPVSGPFAADGAGRLLLVLPVGDGYGVFGSGRGPAGGVGGDFELIYRRKGAVATGLAVGADGTFCVGLTGGVDCIDPQGRIHHVEHELLTNIIGVAFAPDGHLWILRSTEGGTTSLQLVRAAPGFRRVESVLTLRRNVQGFPGNGLAAGPDGSAYLPVIENDVHRVLRVAPDGQFSRVGDFWRLGGGIAVDGAGTVYAPGVKRPQSVEEQRNPVDVLFMQTSQGPAAFAARFPAAPGGARFSGHVALGGDGTVYATRWQRVRIDEGPPQERAVLWQIPLGRGAVWRSAGTVIDFRIPFIDALTNPRMDVTDYAGPLLLPRGARLLITGMNFEGKEGERRVLIGGQQAPIEAWSDEGIVVTVPRDAAGGAARVQVAIDHAASDPEFVEVKTPDVPGWFQIGSPGMHLALRGNLGIIGYNAHIVIEGVTDRGQRVKRDESMETPGLYHIRLPNGEYSVTYSAAYVYNEVWYGRGNEYVGSAHIPVKVPAQFLTFRITDERPITVWMPDMLGLDETPPEGRGPRD